MDKKIFALIVATCAVILVVFIFYFYPLTVNEYAMNVYVGDKVGFNLDTDKLFFGIITPGGVGIKSINVSNTYAKPLKVRLAASGDLAKWAGISNETANPFILQPNETQNVKIIVNIPSYLNKSNTIMYEGKLKVYSYRIFSFN
jgi:hypothetical protein